MKHALVIDMIMPRYHVLVLMALEMSFGSASIACADDTLVSSDEKENALSDGDGHAHGNRDQFRDADKQRGTGGRIFNRETQQVRGGERQRKGGRPDSLPTVHRETPRDGGTGRDTERSDGGRRSESSGGSDSSGIELGGGNEHTALSIAMLSLPLNGGGFLAPPLMGGLPPSDTGSGEGVGIVPTAIGPNNPYGDAAGVLVAMNGCDSGCEVRYTDPNIGGTHLVTNPFPNPQKVEYIFDPNPAPGYEFIGWTLYGPRGWYITSPIPNADGWVVYDSGYVNYAVNPDTKQLRIDFGTGKNYQSLIKGSFYFVAVFKCTAPGGCNTNPSGEEPPGLEDTNTGTHRDHSKGNWFLSSKPSTKRSQ